MPADRDGRGVGGGERRDEGTIIRKLHVIDFLLQLLQLGCCSSHYQI